MEEGRGTRNKRRLRVSDSEESDEMAFRRRGIGRSSNAALGLKMNRSSASKDGGEIEARKFTGDESSGGRSFLRSGMDRNSMYQKNKVKLEAPDVGEDDYGSVGGLSTRLRFRGGSSRSNGSIEMEKKKMKNGHLKCNADNGEVKIERESSQRGAATASIARARDAELIRNSIGKRKFSKVLEGHHVLPGATTRSVHSDRKGSKFEFGDGFCDTGLKVQGKSGVLKLLPNKRMKLAVYEQTCEQMEVEGSRKLLSDSHRNALVGMGKKLNGSLASSNKILKSHCDALANGMNMMQDLKTDEDDSSSSGTESRSISDGLTEAMGRNKRSSQATSSITRGKKEPVNTYHPENTKEKAFRGMGMKERMSTPISALNNHSNQILLNRKAKVCTVKNEDCISSSQESGSIDLSRLKVEMKSSAENVSVMKNSRQSKSSRQTEKQMLRDQIKNMLTEAGWKIDMRPRRGRTYRDHVYVSPAGTEYWSITKAYYALEKQFNVEGDQIDRPDDKENKSFSWIPADVLSMLTRKTVKKKMREQLAKKKQKQEKGSRNAKSNKLKTKSVKKNNIISSATQRGKAMKEKPKGKGKFRKVSEESGDSWQGNSTSINSERVMKPVRVPKSFADSNVSTLRKKNNKQKRYALLARSSNKEDNADSNMSLRYPGKLTVLSWLIDSGTVPENAKVQYMNRRRTKAMLDGWITKEGIHCSCCSKILSVSKFEIHAGSKLRLPFPNIYVETGVSLLQCQLEAWNLQKECYREEFHYVQTDGDDPNDDTCGNCGDGGNLICCDGCPSTFHQGCLNVKMLPAGDWHCPNCSCKFCGIADVDDSPLFSCSLCERKYHQNCTGETNSRPHHSFCGKSCRKLFEQLQKLLGIKNDLDGGYSWTLIQRVDCESERFPRGLSQRAEWNSKIAVALAVMDECFLPIVDRRSGINLIHNVLYNCGSNFSRLNYSGFYTAILERGDEIISAASIRIHGTSLAEMPFIGTRHMYRRQGMFRRLLNAIESVLCSLNVERLIIPSISELMHTWTVVFGFKPLEESHRQEMKSMSLLVFPGTDMLQKSMLKCNLARENSTDDAVGKISDLSGNSHDRHVDANELLVSNFVKPDAHAFKDGLLEHEVTEARDGCLVDGSCQNPVVGSTVTCEPLCNISKPLLGEVDAAAAQASTTVLDTVPQSFGDASENNGQVGDKTVFSEG